MTESPAAMELAPGWDIEKILTALHVEKRNEKRLQLAQFIKERYDKRFFEPIAVLEREALREAPWPTVRPYGFAIMSLACQMVETLESYARGIPTTSKDDFGWMTKDADYKKIPTLDTCKDSDIPGTDQAFVSFFSHYGGKFTGLKGVEFYRKVRNPLLHQCQTRDGWIINIHPPEDALAKAGEVYVEGEKILYRDSFVSQLRCCFTSFIEHLRQHSDQDEIWKNPERKIWWIAWLSDPVYLLDWVKRDPACAS